VPPRRFVDEVFILDYCDRIGTLAKFRPAIENAAATCGRLSMRWMSFCCDEFNTACPELMPQILQSRTINPIESIIVARPVTVRILTRTAAFIDLSSHAR
jgi:hypothetical protein